MSIEHFLLIGPKSISSGIKYETFANNAFEVGLIDSYPKFQELPQYLEHINLWCFPEGYQVLDAYKNVVNNSGANKSWTGKPSMKIREEMAEIKKITHFILTDSEYQKRYCSSLLFYEKYELEEHSEGNNHGKTSIIDRNLLFLPKVLCLVSQHSLLDLQDKLLCFFFDHLLRTKHYQYMPIKTPSLKIPSYLFSRFSDLQKSMGKERGEAFFQDQFPQILAQKAPEKPENVDDIVISETEYFEFFLSVFYHCLPICSPSEDFSVTIEGLRIEDANPVLKYYLSNGQNLYEKQFRTLFQKLQISNVLKIIKFILLEKSIIIFSKKPNESIAVSEALLSLIAPLNWTCIYAPILPISMIGILQAVVPYLIGMHSKHKETVLNSLETSDKVLVDIDEDSVLCCQDNIFLPKSAVDRITSKLTPIVKSLLNHPQQADKPLISSILAVKAAFSDFMLGIINNYLPFFLYSRDYNDKSIASSEIFDHKAYCEIFSPENRQFHSELSSKTMIFNRFLEESYKILYFEDFLKQKRVREDLQESKCRVFITQLKNILRSFDRKTEKKEKFEGFIDLDVKHLQRIIDLEKDLKINLSLENFLKPKVLRLLPLFIQYYTNIFNPEPNLKSRNESFILMKGFNPNKILCLKSSNSHQNVKLMIPERVVKEDDFSEFSSINLPIKSLNIAKGGDESVSEEKKGLIEAILYSEMVGCMNNQKKSRRKTIFAEDRRKNTSDIENLNLEAVMGQLSLKKSSPQKNSESLKTPMALKKCFSEQQNPQKNKESLISKAIPSISEGQNPIKVPALQVNQHSEDPENTKENSQFSIFTYLISDMLNEKIDPLAHFPIKPSIRPNNSKITASSSSNELNEQKNEETLKIPTFSYLKTMESRSKTPKFDRNLAHNEIARTRELINDQRGNNPQKNVESEFILDRTPRKIGFGSRGFVKQKTGDGGEREALKERTLNTMKREEANQRELDSSSYDYNSKLIKKRSFMNG